MRRVGGRKLYTQWGPVGCAQAVSRYSFVGSNDFGPVERNLFRRDDRNAGPLPRTYHWKYHSIYHMRQSHIPLNLNLPSPQQFSWWMIVLCEFPGTDDAILELLGLVSADLFGCSKQLHAKENMSIHHANIIQGFLNVCESVEISVWLRGIGMEGQITGMVVVFSEPCFLAMSSSNPFHSMASSRPRLSSRMCLPFMQFLN